MDLGIDRTFNEKIDQIQLIAAILVWGEADEGDDTGGRAW